MRVVVSGRGRFKIGWGLTWGIAAMAVQFLARNDSGDSFTTVSAAATGPLLSESSRTLLLFVGCGTAAGLGSYVATSGTTSSVAARWRIALVWTAIGLATVAANLYLANHNGPDWWYEPITRTGSRIQTAQRNPWTVHLALTLPIAGALGALYQCLTTTAAAGTRRMVHTLTWMTLWAATFLFVRYVGVIVVYLSYGGVTDLFEAVGSSALAGTIVGTFLGGYVAGHIAGAILSYSPGIVWSSVPRT